MTVQAAENNLECSDDFVQLIQGLAQITGNSTEQKQVQPSKLLCSKHKVQLLFDLPNQHNRIPKLTRDIKKAFQQTKIAIEIQALLQNNNIPFLLIKGLALNQILYGAKLIRPSLDIDFLVSIDQVFEIDQLLISAGYKQLSPSFPIKKQQQKVLLENFDQFLYQHPIARVSIEIHWRLFRNKNILPLTFQELWQEKQIVKIGNCAFHTMGNAQYLAYLLLHGFQHAWERLMWLVDIDLLIKKTSVQDQNNFIALYKKYGFEKQVAICFSLMKLLLQSNSNSFAISNEESDTAKKILYFIPGALAKPLDTNGTRYKLQRLYFEIEHSNSFKARLFYLRNYPLYMYRYVSLPTALDQLYPLFWPYVFVMNKLKNKN